MADIEIDADLTFSAATSRPVDAGFSVDGFNKYGVRENHGDDGELESIDVVYRAMEPGLRKNIRVKPEFLQGVVEGFSEIGSLPAQYDHSQSQRANVGRVTHAWYGQDALYLMSNIPNTGSSIRSDTIADFTHEPPAITDGSVGFGRDYEIEYNSDTKEYEFADATLREFSFTPFPAGYDEGGLSAAFSDAVDSLVNDPGNSGENKDGAVSHARISNARITDLS